MERLTILIEGTHVRVPCLLNPEDREASLTLQRSSGVSRDDGGSLSGAPHSDSPVKGRGWGDTRLSLKLLFDVSLVAGSLRPNDVRQLTGPFWELTEYKTDYRSAQARSQAGKTPPRGQSNRALPEVRLFWGKGWEIPAVVESVAESYERFSDDGRPQRSWLTLGLLRVSDEMPPADPLSRYSALTLPNPEELAAAGFTGMQPDASWSVHVKLGDGVEGDQLWQLAAHYLGDWRLWRWIAIANNIDDPRKISAGTRLKIPPLSVLAAWQRGRPPK